MPAYSEAVKSGLYAKKSGLSGKYDNVRKYWEDELTRHFLWKPLQHLNERVHSEMRRIRILDLGCGSADGLELLMGIRDRDADLCEDYVNLFRNGDLGLYKGLDLNEDLLQQGRQIYGNSPKMVFEQGDFTKDPVLKDGEKPFDLYFSSYGTFSHHNDDESAVRLLTEIAEKTEKYALVVCDWLGRYSYEWQTLWSNDLSENRNMDYVISYIYEKEERERRRDELQHLKLRLMGRQEADNIIEQASKNSGVKIKPIKFFDRSVFTGRHMDTGDYNPHSQEIRYAVNSLHEVNIRTEMSSVKIDYVPKVGFDFLNDYFERLQMCWNRLVDYVVFLMEHYDQHTQRFSVDVTAIPASYPKPLRYAMEKMRHVVEGVGWLRVGMPRENIIEPQLGYALRHMISNLQEGLGGSHGFCCIMEIEK